MCSMERPDSAGASADGPRALPPGMDRWISLELRHLLALSAIARAGTFSGAAEALGYSQSALSQQIAALEQIGRTRLLDRAPGRSPRGLTEAGRLMLRHADAVIARVMMAETELAGLREGTDGRLRVGALPSVGTRLLPQVFRELGTAFPRLQMSLHATNFEDNLVAKLEVGDLDLALCTLPPPDGPFAVIELFSDPYLLVVSRESPRLGSNGTVRFEDLRELPLLAHRTDRWNDALDAALRAAGLAPTLVLSCDDDATLQAFVKAGVGAALMTRLMVDFDDPETVAYELDGIPPRRIGLLHHADRPLSPMAARFLALAEAALLSGDQATTASA